MKQKVSGLTEIYSSFTADTRPFRPETACGKGCSFCCEAAGSIDITTLEGLAIREAMENMPKTRHKTLTKAFRSEIRRREAGEAVPCPFLMKNRACMIYEVRPFSCRRIYSVHPCSPERPPALSRQVMERGDLAVRSLQTLDNTGYSGHLSYILYMLSVPAFLTPYLAGEFRPEEISEFGKAHRIVINRMMA